MNITGFSDFAASVLSGEEAGTVHSVYRNTVNLSFGRRIISLQPAESTVSPLSLLTDCTDLSALRIRRGDPAGVSRHVLHIAGRFVFSFGPQTVLFSTRPAENRRLSADGCLLTGITISGVLQRLAPPQSISRAVLSPGDLPPSIPYLAEERSVLEEAEAALSRGDSPGAAAALRGLIGLGPGLTPSGDDFLTGVLLAFELLPPGECLQLSKELRRVISGSADMTTDLSAQFLRCACERHYSLPFLALQEAAACEDAVRITEDCRKIAAIGHSSGCDTLAGILWILDQFRTEERIDTW